VHNNDAAAGRTVIAVSSDPPSWLLNVIINAGCVVGVLSDAQGLIHLTGPATLPELPPTVRWVQLPGAGIEAYLARGLLDNQRVWTSAAGAYARTVAEHAVALLLAGLRGLVIAAHQTSWQRPMVSAGITGLVGSTVAVVGAGAIGRRVIELIEPFDASVIAVTRSGRSVPGAVRSLGFVDLKQLWGEVDHVVLAAPSTAQTHRMIDKTVLAQLRPTSWIVNVGRGELVATDDLVDALHAGKIAGAALDVTDPEPLPDGHILWSTPGVLISPHCANPPEHLARELAWRVAENLRRFLSGRELIGIVNIDAGY
jgi:D-3-phosphoglycerate dehydrogenase